jgi:hypothetical protein
MPGEAKPFKFVEAIPIDIEFVNEAVWIEKSLCQLLVDV